MYKIVKKRALTDNIYLMDIEAPRVAKSAEPGQFIIIKNDEKGERIPLTIADYNSEKGTVTIVFQAVGRGTKELIVIRLVNTFVSKNTKTNFLYNKFFINFSPKLHR